MSALHTPGPWHVDKHCSTMIWSSTDPYGHGQMRIADIRGWGHLTGQGACRFSEDRAAAIQDANAQLIAAAPDLKNAVETAPILSKYNLGNPYELQRFVTDYTNWRATCATALTKAAVL